MSLKYTAKSAAKSQASGFSTCLTNIQLSGASHRLLKQHDVLIFEIFMDKPQVMAVRQATSSLLDHFPNPCFFEAALILLPA